MPKQTIFLWKGWAQWLNHAIPPLVCVQCLALCCFCVFAFKNVCCMKQEFWYPVFSNLDWELHNSEFWYRKAYSLKDIFISDKISVTTESTESGFPTYWFLLHRVSRLLAFGFLKAYIISLVETNFHLSLSLSSLLNAVKPDLKNNPVVKHENNHSWQST